MFGFLSIQLYKKFYDIKKLIINTYSIREKNT